MKLKNKLILSYIIISLLWGCLLFFIGNYFFERQFKNYILKSLEIKYEEIKQTIINAYDSDGNPPHDDFFIEYGNRLIDQNLILTVYDANNNEVFCMACVDEDVCNHKLVSMEEMMRKLYPNFKGYYSEKRVVIVKNDRYLGYASIGFYGPYFYNQDEYNFVKNFNNLLLLIVFIFFIISIALGIYSANKISKPIKKVIDQTKNISNGDYSKNIRFKNNILEVNELINSINTLTNNLNIQLKTKKQMANDFTHEFLTPLTVIQNNIEAIIDGVFKPTNDRLNLIKNEVERLTRMINDVEKLVALTDEKIELKKTKFDVRLLIEDVLKNFETQIKIRNIQIIFENKQLDILADYDKMTQVMFNLISNAIKYNKTNGYIKIDLDNIKNTIVIEDNGIGIHTKDIPFIFEYLYRVDKSRNKEVEGLGIGLYVVKNIIDAHNGSISISSKLKKGTKFVIKLPKN